MSSLDFNKYAAAILVAALLIKVIDIAGNTIMPPPAAPEVVASSTATAPGTAAPPSTPAAPEAPPAPLPQRLASADLKAGEASAHKCLTCHTLKKGEAAKIGPNLYGVVGRPKGSFPGFAYSSAISGAGGTWTYDDLEKFLTAPSSAYPGTKMTFAGLKDPVERANVIADLRTLNDNPPPLPAK